MQHAYISLGLLGGGVVAAVFGSIKNKQAGLYGSYKEVSQPAELTTNTSGYFGGTVVALQGQPALTTPYSKQPCVYYSYVIEQEIRDRGSSGMWHTYWQRVSAAPPQSVIFGLQAPGGTVLVNATDASVNVTREYEAFIDAATVNGRPDAPNTLDKVENLYNRVEGRRMRVRESYIPLGQQLYAGGTVVEQGQGKTFTNSQSYPLILTAQSKADLVASDKRTGILEYGGAAALIIASVIVFIS